MDSAETRKFSNVRQRLGVRLRRATFALRRLLMSRLGPLGFTHEQYVILLFLNEQDAVTQSELAKRSFTNPNTVKDILNRLEADGLVRRRPNETDRRANRVEITPKGQKLRTKLVAIADEITMEVLGTLRSRDNEVFLRCLDLIAEAAEESSRATPSS